MKVIFAVFAVFALAAAPCASAQTASPKTESKPLSTLAQQAQQGDAQAQYRLGMAHKTGSGAPRDVRAAFGWFVLAGGAGDVAAAAVEAARAAELGTGTKKNLAEAARWWHRASELGDEPAKARFVDLVLTGQIRTLGGTAGADWIEAAADEGDARAPLILGEAYELGLGVLPNVGKALYWYRAAAFLGDSDARYRLGRYLLLLPGVIDVREDGSVDVSRPGMVEGERWLEAAALQGNADAQMLLGRAYGDGIDLPADFVLARRWLEAAAWQGSTDALVSLARLALRGHGFPAKDPVRAWLYHHFASLLGSRAGEQARERLTRSLPASQLDLARLLFDEIAVLVRPGVN